MPFRFNPITDKLDLVQVSLSPTGDVAFLSGNSGTNIPPNAFGNINVVGLGSLNVDGNVPTNTLTIELNNTTDHAVIVGAGTSTITSLAVGTSGQVLTGSTGADPAFASLGTDSGLTAHGVVIAEGNSAFVATAVGAAGQVLTGQSAADPKFSPLGTNSGLTNHGVLLAQGNGPFVTTVAPTNGEVLIGGTGVDPAFATLTAGANITITNASNSVTIAVSGTPIINTYTAVSSSPYVVTSTDYYLSIDTTSAITIKLPDSTTQYRTFILKDKTGSSSSNNITLTTVTGAVLIDGATSQLISNNYGALNIIWNGTTYEIF